MNELHLPFRSYPQIPQMDFQRVYWGRGFLEAFLHWHHQGCLLERPFSAMLTEICLNTSGICHLPLYS